MSIAPGRGPRIGCLFICSGSRVLISVFSRSHDTRRISAHRKLCEYTRLSGDYTRLHRRTGNGEMEAEGEGGGKRNQCKCVLSALRRRLEPLWVGLRTLQTNFFFFTTYTFVYGSSAACSIALVPDSSHIIVVCVCASWQAI